MNEGRKMKLGKTLIDPYGEGLGGFTRVGEQALHEKNMYHILRILPTIPSRSKSL